MSSEPANDRSLELLRFDSAAEFAEATMLFLLEHEVQNGLMLGLTTQLIADPLTYGTPPYLALVRDATTVLVVGLVTPPWPLAISPATDSGAIAILATDLWQHHPTLPGVNGPSNEARTFASIWEQLSGYSAKLASSMRIYRADSITQPDNVSGSLRRATAADRSLMIDWMGGFFADVHQGSQERHTIAEDIDRWMHDPDGGWYIWDNSQPVSLVGYGGPTRQGIRVGPVYTPPSHRRRGYASAATAAVSQSLLDQGRRFCYLYTDVNNPTSNKIYQAIGFRHVSDAEVHRFLKPQVLDRRVPTSPVTA